MKLPKNWHILLCALIPLGLYPFASKIEQGTLVLMAMGWLIIYEIRTRETTRNITINIESLVKTNSQNIAKEVKDTLAKIIEENDTQL